MICYFETLIWITRSLAALACIDSQFYFSGIAMSVEPVQQKMEDFINIVMNVNVVSNNLGVIVKSVTDALYQIMTSVQVIQLRKWRC